MLFLVVPKGKSITKVDIKANMNSSKGKSRLIVDTFLQAGKSFIMPRDYWSLRSLACSEPPQSARSW